MKLADINKTKRAVKSSVEVRWLSRTVIAFASLTVLIALSAVLVLSMHATVHLSFTFCILLVILILISMRDFFSLYKILQKVKEYEFYDGLVTSDNGRNRSLSLHITAKDEDGKELSFDTSAIYDKYTRLGPCPYDYYKRRVLVGYNKVTNICVIIRTFRENETFEECIERAIK